LEKIKEPKKKIKNSNKKNKILKIVLILVIIMLLITGCLYGTYRSLVNGGPLVDFVTKMLGGTVRGDEPVYVLVLGVNPPLSDTIMLVRL